MRQELISRGGAKTQRRRDGGMEGWRDGEKERRREGEKERRRITRSTHRFIPSLRLSLPLSPLLCASASLREIDFLEALPRQWRESSGHFASVDAIAQNFRGIRPRPARARLRPTQERRAIWAPLMKP